MSTSVEGREFHTDAELRALLGSTHRVAVLGIKIEAAADRPAHYVPAYLKQAGLALIPVPVYYPEATEILGEKVYREVAKIPQPVDLVCVFRRPQDLQGHLQDLIKAKPRAVWLQLGIRDDEFAAALRAVGIDVVQDRCLMVEHRRLMR